MKFKHLLIGISALPVVVNIFVMTMRADTFEFLSFKPSPSL